MQLGLGWIFVGAYAVENGRLSQIAVLGASSLSCTCTDSSDPCVVYGTKYGRYVLGLRIAKWPDSTIES